MKYWLRLTVLLVALSAFAAAQSLTIYPVGDSLTKAVNDSVVFKCVADGLDNEEADPNLKWLDIEGQEITETAGRKFIGRDDKQELKLYIVGIRSVDAGVYGCTGTLEGSPVTKSIRLSIYKDITFDHAPSPQNPTLHTLAFIECQVSGQPIPDVSWKYKGQKLPNGGRYSMDNEGLYITNVTEEDNGDYYCHAEVTIDGRFDERKIYVEVYILPEVTVPPGDVEGIEKQDTSLKCLATGKPTPQYEFYKDDNEFPVSPDDRIEVDKDNGEIAFRPLQKGDEGDYTCKAINQAGDDTGVGFLFVVVPPRVTELLNVSRKEDDSATLKCVTVADPAATMSFRKVGNLEDYKEGENDGGRIIVQSSTDEISLTINDLNPDDTSNYTCKAANRGGDISKNGTIVVEFEPRFEDDHVDHFYNWAGKSRNMSCHALGEPEPHIEWVRYDQVLNNNETYYVHRMGRTSNLAVTIRNEDQAWIFGDYQCRASNDHGTGEVTIELLRATVPDEPQEVSTSEATPTTVVLEVTPPVEDGGVEIYGYRVEYESKSQDFTMEEEIRIENLRPQTAYVFRVRAKNEVGAGAPKDYAHETEAIRTPYPIEIISDPNGLNPYTYLVQWKPPRTGGLPITEYRIRHRRVKVDEDWNIVEPLEGWTNRDKQDDPNNPMLNYELLNLKQDQHYEVEVTAKNDLGWSSEHPDFVFKTAEDANAPDESKDGDKGAVGTVASKGGLSTGAIIGIIIAIFLIFLIIVDISCYFINHCGVLAMICAKTGGGAGGKSAEKSMEEGERDQLKEPPADGGEENKEALKQELEAEEVDEKTPLAGEEEKEAAPQPASDEDLKGKTIESADQQPLTEQAA